MTAIPGKPTHVKLVFRGPPGSKWMKQASVQGADLVFTFERDPHVAFECEQWFLNWVSDHISPLIAQLRAEYDRHHQITEEDKAKTTEELQREADALQAQLERNRQQQEALSKAPRLPDATKQGI